MYAENQRLHCTLSELHRDVKSSLNNSVLNGVNKSELSGMRKNKQTLYNFRFFFRLPIYIFFIVRFAGMTLVSEK